MSTRQAVWSASSTQHTNPHIADFIGPGVTVFAASCLTTCVMQAVIDPTFADMPEHAALRAFAWERAYRLNSGFPTWHFDYLVVFHCFPLDLRSAGYTGQACLNQQAHPYNLKERP